MGCAFTATRHPVRLRVAWAGMSSSNRDRRRAKQKARDKRRVYTATDAESAYRAALEIVDLATDAEGADRDEVLHHLTTRLDVGAGRALVDRVLTDLLDTLVDNSWPGGWQPVDLVRFARRELGDAAAALTVDGIAMSMRRYPASRVDPRWAAQVADLKADVWWTDERDRADGSAERAGVTRELFIRLAVDTLALLRNLVRLPVLLPLPGQGRAATDPRQRPDVSGRTLDRIRALLAKAESTTFAEEAETYTAKAQELMTRHSIDAALLAVDRPATGPEAVRLGVDAPYEASKSLLLSVVADANRCRTVWARNLGFSTVFGFRTDLELVELLYTSLLVQATTAMTAEGPRRDHHGRSSTRSFRQSFLTAYANRIGERLADATGRVDAQAAAEVGAARLLPVLAARDEAVRERLAEAFPHVVQQTVSITNAEGWHSGRAAADRASLQPRRQLPDG